MAIISHRSLRRFISFVGAACCAFASKHAALAAEPSRADALYKTGLEQMRAGQYETACPMLDKSYQLDPLPGTLFAAGDCESARGKVATAIERYQSFVDALSALPADKRTKFDERERLALERMAGLGPLAPELTVDTLATAPPRLVIKRNGTPIARTAYGVSKRVDPAEYLVSAELDGQVIWERRLTLSSGDRTRVDVPWSEPLKPAPITAAPAPPLPTPADSGPSTTRILAYVSLGVGVGGLVAGLVTGAIAVQQKGAIDDNCPGRLCNATGRVAVEEARATANVSTIGVTIGLVGVTSAVILWMVSSPSPKRTDAATVVLRPLVIGTNREAGVGLEGTF